MSDPGVEKVSQHPTEKAFDGDDSDRQDHGHGEVTFIGDHGAESELHITMIALGSSIGMGLWLGSGSSLASGGPAAMFLGYLLSGTMIWTVSQSIGEMAVM
jgi:amino acid transporter